MARAELAVVILAAGKGTRLRSQQAKVLHRAGGRALIEHVVRAALPLDAPIFVVVGHQADQVAALVAPLGAQTILQEPQRGTGHSLQVAQTALGEFRRALVAPGDAPLVRAETLLALAAAHRAARAAATVLSASLADPTGYGRIVRRQDGTVAAIVEESAAGEPERAIREINSGMYCFELAKLWPCLGELQQENKHHELYLTDAVAILNRRRERVAASLARDPMEILGCNTRKELAEADRLLRRRKIDALMEAGVTVYLPETVLVDPDVEVGADTVIEPCVELLGSTRIGQACTVSTGSVIADSVLEDRASVRPHSVVMASRLGRGAVVGPFAHLRDGADLGPGARVGNYVEVKKSRLAAGVKALHLSYLGDASIGRDSNIGAGTITCNYDGIRKNPTTIGERVFVGSGSELIAPIEIGDGAYIAAGSTITESVPADAMAFARARQETKPGRARLRREQIQAASLPPAPKAAPSPGGDGAKPLARKARAKRRA
ncbi:MAG TPA: bifunctional UDP-N-acetylglucosamine diphosphorylase/glucosamine-1-phosphate N-acetyltransferase GlmU [Candidatus Acidoferrales bacterium]|nr:bifunctional UDP-N-acetylglucosamine diphosphorylase/glucosamine-1-phosphate N-acetyltransferase GlmU [Candidatus Acidoferrales bacterium]